MSSFTHSDDIPVLTALTDEQVADYLRRNPDFLADKPSLLADLNLPHNLEGKAISLVERQVAVLRDRNMDMRGRLNTLLDNARSNDYLFEKTKRLILEVLDHHQLDDCLDALFFGLQNEFDIQFSTLLIIDEHIEIERPANQQAQVFGIEAVREGLPSFIQNPRALCGKLDEAELSFVFSKQASLIGSTALAPLKHKGKLLGLLAIAHRDEDHYRTSMNTLFLGFITDVFSRILARYAKAPCLS